jgi:hypothetical protein
MEYFLTLVVTTFRRNDFLLEAVSSIYNSIFQFRKNCVENNFKFEILIYDDNPEQTSSFRSEFLGMFEKRDHLTSIKYKINSANLGDYFNRNQGIKDAKGFFLKYVDDDDILYENSISLIASTIKNSCYEEKLYIYYVRDNFRHLKFPIELNTADEIIRFHYLDFGLFHCSLVSTVFPTKYLKQAGGFFCKRFYGDFELLNRLSILSSFKIFPYELGYYRIHSNQESEFNRKYDRLNFNYLLITTNFFGSSRLDLNIDLFKRLILLDNFNFLKRSLKSFNFMLLLDVLRLFFYVLKFKKISDLSQLKAWQTFYKSRMCLLSNELTC